MIDNYDSFTYNLVQYLGELGAAVDVRRNDAVTLKEVGALRPDGVVISPGPCTPREAGISVPLIERFAGELPILGVCLGHQAIGAAFGGAIVHAGRIMHGKTSPILHDGRAPPEGKARCRSARRSRAWSTATTSPRPRWRRAWRRCSRARLARRRWPACWSRSA